MNASRATPWKKRPASLCPGHEMNEMPASRLLVALAKNDLARRGFWMMSLKKRLRTAAESINAITNARLRDQETRPGRQDP